MPTKPMKQEPAGKSKMTIAGKQGQFSGPPKMSKEFAKYAAMGMKPSNHLPNAMVKGVRNGSDAELVQQYQGDPDAGARSGTPYYEANGQARHASESAVDRENIPAQYRPQVKAYFDHLKH